MHHAQISFLPLLIVALLAFAVPLLLAPIRRYGIPVVVGEIVAGIVFGRSGLGLIHRDIVLQVLAAFGFAYLMFLSGLEIDFSGTANADVTASGSRKLENPFLLGAMMFALSAGLSVLVGFGMVRLGLAQDPWIMTMILTTTSLGVVAPVLKERGLTGDGFGQTILISALLADFLTILAIGAYVLLLDKGASPRILLVLVLFVAFVFAWLVGARFQRFAAVRRVMQALSTATAQIRVRAAFAIILIFMALAETLGVVSILGAFLAGVIIALLSSSGSGMLREKLDAIGFGFFIPVFFIMVGAGFDLSALMGSDQSLALVPVLIVAAYLVKSLAALVMRLGFDWRETFAAGALLSARLSFIVAVAEIGLQIGVISEAVDSAIILVAVVTCTVSPILFSRLLPRKLKPGDRVFIVGSRFGAGMLAERLAAHDLDVALVREVGGADPATDSGEDSRARLLQRLRETGLTEAGTAVVMAEDGAETFRVAHLARQVFGIRNVIAWVENPADNQRFRDAGVRVVNPQYSTLLMLEGLVLNPAALSVGVDPDEDQEVRMVKLQNPALTGRALGQLFPPGTVRVLRIVRGNDSLIPDKTAILQINDTVTLCGEVAEVDACARRLASR